MKNLVLEKLRAKHPRFIYETYDIKKKNGNISIRFLFKTEPKIEFSPRLIVPNNPQSHHQNLETFVFNLGLVEAISYWKATCSPELVIKAGKLTDEQKNWWRTLFINGLGEFFYKNSIDFSSDNFLSIRSTGQKGHKKMQPFSLSGDLILASGGKDSALTLELLKKSKQKKKIFLLNPSKAAIEIVKMAGYENPLIAKREIDAKLLELNSKGYLNGHTPFSAYLAFLGSYVAFLHHLQNVIVSNERSADEGNIYFHHRQINHQYSKSYGFEKLFREYSSRYLTSNIKYFSFLRPLYDLRISELFAKYPQYLKAFKSCNVGQKADSWCGKCAKCAFSYLSLAPFIPHKKMVEIFGSDYFKNKNLASQFHNLVGFGKYKPFDCVGTIDESRLSIALTIERYKKDNVFVPKILLDIKKKLTIASKMDIRILKEKVLGKWSSKNFLPKEHAALLKKAIQK